MGFSALTRAKTEENNGFRIPLPYVFAARRTVGHLREDFYGNDPADATAVAGEQFAWAGLGELVFV